VYFALAIGELAKYLDTKFSEFVSHIFREILQIKISITTLTLTASLACLKGLLQNIFVQQE
jgi:hypothetical protein